MTEDGQRLSKVVALRMPCSRRDAELYIDQGWVRVDGELVEEPQFRVSESQRVEIDPRARLQPPVPATLLVHKPAGMDTREVQALFTEAAHWSGDTSGIRRSRSHGVGVRSLMELPTEASGLAVFSQDGRVLRKLTEDAALIEQELIAQVQGTIAPDGLARLGRGLLREGKPLPPAHVSWQSETRLRIAAKGIAPQWVPWMCAQVGLELVALRRIRIGRVSMAGLPAGQWRHLAPGERF